MTGSRYLAGDDYLIRGQTALERQLCRLEGRDDHAVVDDLVRRTTEGLVSVLLHLGHDQLLVERAAVDANSDRPSVVAGDCTNGGKLFVAPVSGSHVAGVDSILVQRRGAGRISSE